VGAALWIGLAAIVCLSWGAILLVFPEPIARFSRRVQGEFWGGQFTPELTRFLGVGFVLAGAVAAGSLLVSVLRG
jgi:hypothetical protein